MFDVPLGRTIFEGVQQNTRGGGCRVFKRETSSSPSGFCGPFPPEGGLPFALFRRLLAGMVTRLGAGACDYLTSGGEPAVPPEDGRPRVTSDTRGITVSLFAAFFPRAMRKLTAVHGPKIRHAGPGTDS